MGSFQKIVCKSYRYLWFWIIYHKQLTSDINLLDIGFKATNVSIVCYVSPANYFGLGDFVRHREGLYKRIKWSRNPRWTRSWRDSSKSRIHKNKKAYCKASQKEKKKKEKETKYKLQKETTPDQMPQQKVLKEIEDDGGEDEEVCQQEQAGQGGEVVDIAHGQDLGEPDQEHQLSEQVKDQTGRGGDLLGCTPIQYVVQSLAWRGRECNWQCVYKW